jgi:hypothetical protein
MASGVADTVYLSSCPTLLHGSIHTASPRDEDKLQPDSGNSRVDMFKPAVSDRWYQDG